MSPANPLWTQTVYNTLIGLKQAKVDRESDLPPVKEATTDNSANEQKSQNGCNTQ